MEEQGSLNVSHFEGLANKYPSSKESISYSGAASGCKRWVPQNSYSSQSHKDHDETLRKIRGVLNKITPEKFEPLCQEILNIGIDSKFLLEGIAVLIYEKAVDEHRYSSLYANLCRRLWFEAPNFDGQRLTPDHNWPKFEVNTFRHCLIKKLQQEFENRYQKAYTSDENEVTATEQEFRDGKSKHHVLGNIKFIGELYRLDVLHEGILHVCIKQLIRKSSSTPPGVAERNLECFCQIMITCGRKLDHTMAKLLIDQYFARIEYLRKKGSFSSRIRFMLQDVIDLRINKWVPRRSLNSKGPRTLGQIRSEMGEENPNLMFDPEFMRIISEPHQQHQRGQGNAGSLYYNKNSSNGGQQGLRQPRHHHPNNHGHDYHETDAMGRKPLFDFFSSAGNGGEQKDIKDLSKQEGGKVLQNYIGKDQQVEANNHLVHNNESRQPMLSNQRKTSHQTAAASGGFSRSSEYDLFPKWNRSKQEVSRAESINGKPQSDEMNSNGKQQQQYATTRSLSSVVASSTLNQPVSNSSISNNKQQQASQQRASGGVQNFTKLGGVRGLSKRTPMRMTSPAPQTLMSRIRSVDAFQPEYQHVLDQALQAATSKSTASRTSAAAPESQEENSTKSKQLQQQHVVSSHFPQQQECKENLEQIARQLLVANVKTNEYQHHFNRLSKLSTSIIQECSVKLVQKSLVDCDDKLKLKACLVLRQIVDKSLLDSTTIDEIFQTSLDEITSDNISSAGFLLANAIGHNLLELSSVVSFLGNTTDEKFSVFLATLKQLSDADLDNFTDNFKKCEINLFDMMPEASRNDEGLFKEIDEHGLNFLTPLLAMTTGLKRQLSMEPCCPNDVYKWLCENVSVDLHQDTRFIGILLKSSLQHVTATSTLKPGFDPDTKPFKHLEKQEKLLFRHLGALLQKFLHDKPDLQLTALYTLQDFCFENNFPKGLMGRLFSYLYDEDIVDEEIFFKWKVDINENYPGKSKALLQVKTWLTWLQEADTEDDDE